MKDNNVIDNEQVVEVPTKIEEGMTSEEMWDVIRNVIGSCKTIKEINDFLETLTISNRYVAIRDLVGRTKDRMIRDQRYLDEESKEEYQRYQQIKQEAEESYKHDNKAARMIDVDRACTQVYSILLRMISEQQKMIDKLQKAVNAVERETEIEPTEWHPEEVINNDNDTEKNVQGE